MYKYALKYEIVDKDYSAFLYIPKEDDDEAGVPFSAGELKILWKNYQDPVVEMLLIMCYSGFRIKAYIDIEVDLERRCFIGGINENDRKRMLGHSFDNDITNAKYGHRD